MIVVTPPANNGSLIKQVGFALTYIRQEEPVWDWWANEVSEEVRNAYPFEMIEASYVMLGQMLFNEAIDESYGYFMGLYLDGEDQGMLAVWDGSYGFENTLAFLPEQIPADGLNEGTPAFIEDFRVLTPEVGDWEDNAGGLDWQWGSDMDFDNNEWNIWNYGTVGAEWAEGEYLVLYGQSNGDADVRYIFTDTIALGASALAATAMGIAAIAATLF